MRSIPVLARSSIIPDLVAVLGSRQGAHCNEGCIRPVHITPDCQPGRCNLLQRGQLGQPDECTAALPGADIEYAQEDHLVLPQRTPNDALFG